MKEDDKDVENLLNKVYKDGNGVLDDMDKILELAGIDKDIERPLTPLDFNTPEEFEVYKTQYIRAHKDEIREMIFYLLENIENEGKYDIVFSMVAYTLPTYRIMKMVEDIEDDTPEY